MDYTQFKKDRKDVLMNIRMECMREMYQRSQPQCDYDTILNYYKECEEKGVQPEDVFERHYLSQEEFLYVLNKYISIYGLRDEFKDHCDILIRDMEDGCTKDKYIPNHIDKNGRKHPGHRGYEKVPPLGESIGEENARKVIDFIKMRKEFYRFNVDEEKFSTDISLTDSPSADLEAVKEYWKTQGEDIKIDPRHEDVDYFWDEENGYIEEEEEDEDEDMIEK